jgi:hypothetical protein
MTDEEKTVTKLSLLAQISGMLVRSYMADGALYFVFATDKLDSVATFTKYKKAKAFARGVEIGRYLEGGR